jgi:hypothetical protein
VARLAIALLVCCALPGSARAETSVRVVAYGGAAVAHARAGEEVGVRVVMRARGRLVALPPEARIRWLRVVPHMQHRDTPPPNDGIAQYSNSVLFGPDHGRWIGLDAVEYESVPLEASERVSIDGSEAVVRGSPNRRDGAGTLWLAADVTMPDGTVLRTPDHDDVDRLGLAPSVMRVSFRASDDFVGWLSTYFGVPNIFGSTRGQSERYVGADCADVLVGARRASGDRSLQYTSVTGIGRYAEAVTPALRMGADGAIVEDTDEAPPTVLRWGRDVEPGDLFAIDYADPDSRLPRAWDHIGALGRDADGDGVLSAGDTLRHMAPSGLVDSPIDSQAPMRFRVWRWRR